MLVVHLSTTVCPLTQTLTLYNPDDVDVMGRLKWLPRWPLFYTEWSSLLLSSFRVIIKINDCNKYTNIVRVIVLIVIFYGFYFNFLFFKNKNKLYKNKFDFIALGQSSKFVSANNFIHSLNLVCQCYRRKKDNDNFNQRKKIDKCFFNQHCYHHYYLVARYLTR